MKIANGDFDLGFSRDNLWTGVDAQGFLRGFRSDSQVLLESGGIGSVPMPLSVAVEDMNHDGRLDIVATDPTGYTRVYFNKAEAGEAKFTFGEFTLPFLTRWQNQSRTFCSALRVATDRSTDRVSLVFGNYGGEILRVPNTGSPTSPKFNQPAKYSDLVIPTTKNPQALWGNVLSPVVVDWNDDGKPDLLLGEGSYSANNIHLLLNQGTKEAPKYNEDQHYVVAYGDGREQLSIAVVDYDGDGQKDLLVTDRQGRIGLYKNPGASWKPGIDFPFTSFLADKNNQPLSLGGICTIATGDLTGDGLFDIVAGRQDGRISLIKNVGTATEPRWESAAFLKSSEPAPAADKLPSGWIADPATDDGNYFGVIQVVSGTEARSGSPATNNFVRFSYAKPANQILSVPDAIIPGRAEFKISDAQKLDHTQFAFPSNWMFLTVPITGKLKLKATYRLTFRVKGDGARDCFVQFRYGGLVDSGVSKKVYGGRDSVRELRDVAKESVTRSMTFNPSPQWSEQSKEVTITFDQLKGDNIDVGSGEIVFAICLPPGSGEVCLDDVRLVEKS